MNVLFCRLLLVVCHYHITDEEVQLQCGKAFSRCLPYPFHLPRNCRLRAFRGINGPIIVHFEMQANDIGLTSSQREHPFASTADEDGWMRTLKRPGKGF